MVGGESEDVEDIDKYNIFIRVKVKVGILQYIDFVLVGQWVGILLLFN